MKRQGFSLVELSIVLVILGLLTGGILSGQSLIRAAELRSVVTQASQYMAAIQTFRDRYRAIPGDMPNAVKFWGAQAGDTTDGRDATCAALTTPATGIATCNGNGDGLIGIAGGGSNTHEIFRFWQHLANAGLIEGTYSGITGSSGTTMHHVPGVNSPTSRIGRGGWTAVRRNSGGDGNFFTIDYGNTLQLGMPSSGGTTYIAIMKPEEAWNMDTKLDDGKPAQGKFIGLQWDTCTTATASTQLDVEYRLDSSAIGCALVIRQIY